jgi:hypothetical protein
MLLTMRKAYTSSPSKGPASINRIVAKGKTSPAWVKKLEHQKNIYLRMLSGLASAAPQDRLSMLLKRGVALITLWLRLKKHCIWRRAITYGALLRQHIAIPLLSMCCTLPSQTTSSWRKMARYKVKLIIIYRITFLFRQNVYFLISLPMF